MGADGDVRETYRQITENQLEFEGEAWEDKSALALGFIQQLLRLEPEKRPVASAALQHLWLLQAPVEEEEMVSNLDEDEGEFILSGFSCYAPRELTFDSLRSKGG